MIYREVSAEKLLEQLVIAAQSTCNFIRTDDDKWHNINVIDPIMKFQMTNLAKWCKLLGKNYKRRDWSGNDYCGTNHDEIYFEHQGVEFFELVEKEK